jgi:hypothetical protein
MIVLCVLNGVFLVYVFGGNVDPACEELVCTSCQFECTRVHEESLALLVPRIPLVQCINVHAFCHGLQEQHLECCFVLHLRSIICVLSSVQNK